MSTMRCVVVIVACATIVVVAITHMIFQKGKKRGEQYTRGQSTTWNESKQCYTLRANLGDVWADAQGIPCAPEPTVAPTPDPDCLHEIDMSGGMIQILYCRKCVYFFVSSDDLKSLSKMIDDGRAKRYREKDETE